MNILKWYSTVKIEVCSVTIPLQVLEQWLQLQLGAAQKDSAIHRQPGQAQARSGALVQKAMLRNDRKSPSL